MPGITPMISPGVRVNVVDQSQYTPITGSPLNAFAIVGGAQFGPINTPTLLTSVNQFIQIFSTPIDDAGLAATLVLATGTAVYYCRAASASAAKMTGTITGTGAASAAANLTIEATQKGTLLDGTWKAIVTTANNEAAAQFKLKVVREVSGETAPIVVLEETELSVLSTASNYYTSWNNDYFTLVPATTTAPTSITPGTYTISGGNNGIDSTLANNATAINAAANMFSDRETYEIMYLAAPNYSIIGSVGTNLKSIATSRKDCVVQIDLEPNPESDVYKTDGAFDIAKVVAALSSYQGTPYIGMWAGLGGYVADPYNNNAPKLVPVSVYLLPALATEYSTSPVWTAPASVSRLNLTLLTRLDKIWTQAERDALYAANINPITNYKGLGYTSMGQKSGQTTKSAMDRLNVVQLVNFIKVSIEKMSVDFLFAPIDEETFSSWVYRIGNFLSTIKSRRGLYDYRVKMDWETVTPDAVNNNLMPGIVQIKPTKVSEFIDVDLVIKNYSDSMD